MEFRLRGPAGQTTLKGVASEGDVGAFLDQVADATGVSKICLQLLVGFPPKPLQLPNNSDPVSSLGLRTGEAITVREVEPAGSAGVVARRIIESDNSCLFNAIGYVMEGRRGMAPGLRQVIAERIKKDPETYSEVFLARANDEYCDWILKSDSWGGAIELSIFAEHFQCEIAAFDVCTMRRDLYGEGSGYSRRCMVLYDGIHYDALALTPKTDSAEAEDTTMFDVGPVADHAGAKAAAFVAEQNKLRQFTDTANFTLRCLVCQQGVCGNAEAEQHAKATGHQSFAEYTR
eukprot:TRINITY_DN43006_c0_g1_i1.p1 TRINITY_DN43006_c0_g1~~TRINITY_DN43006_c0_g1_i1.p1  ORF type:complete len:289 (-),score=39.11 TRINITY_DN43006_c0_g1_i1:252-1118(-)